MERKIRSSAEKEASHLLQREAIDRSHEKISVKGGRKDVKNGKLFDKGWDGKENKKV